MTTFDKSSSQRGALMVEAIALLGLMTMISPMIVRQTAERTTEMEDVAVAGQMKTIKDALENYIQADYANLVPNPPTQEEFQHNITAAKLSPYLPSSYIDGGEIRGNKLADGFDVGVRGFCTEKQDNRGATCSTLSASCKCTRYKIVGMIVSKKNNNEEIPDKRAARVASMLGADGGYMRTSDVVNAVAGGGAADAMKKVLGAQGMWEVDDVTKYISGIGTNSGGRIALSTVFSSGLSADYLYRKKVNGLPDANSMFTDLDMGGNGACEDASGDGKCNRINNAGGLEVIAGRLIVRKKNGAAADNQADGSGDTLARIALGTDKASMQVEKSVTITANKLLADDATKTEDGSIQIAASKNINAKADDNFVAEAKKKAEMKTSDDKLRFVAEDGTISMEAYSSGEATDPTSEVSLTSEEATMSGPAVTVEAGTGGMELNSDDEIKIAADKLLNMSGATGVNMTSPEKIEIKSDKTMTLHAGTEMKLESDETISIMGNKSAKIGSGDNHLIVSNKAADDKGTIVNGDTAHNGSYAEVVGGLYINTANSHVLSVGAGGVASVLLQDGGITMHKSDGKKPGMIGTANKDDVVIKATSSGGVITLSNKGREHPAIELRGDTGLISATAFQPDYVINNNGDAVQPVVKRGGVSFSSSGVMDSNSITSVTATTFDKIATDSGVGGSKTYNVHQQDATLNRFRVDPAFVSVMNDIKITSRGGARLSEALPNYILKGIYELSNTYAKGPWPCAASCSSISDADLAQGTACCTYSLPRIFVKDEDGSDHILYYPADDIPSSGGNVDPATPSASTTEYKINLYAGSYTDCPNDGNCLAHPFMGVVPAPGRQASTSGLKGGDAETMAAWDEGVCPDGYVAAMTVTPSQFDVGRVSYVNTYVPIQSDDTGEYLAYISWNQGHPSIGGVFQPATSVGIAIKDITSTSDGSLQGWGVAMGTVGWGFTDETKTDATWMWNYGANIQAGMMKAYAQTYCYFNPKRFNMPNMKVIQSSGGNVITPMNSVNDL
ncbi:MAG TPA: hypothetical protein DD624_08175 [Alphaproteobacteria bacterium]|nr:hypothetical protein [Alphaproteobacteria bacterium]